MKKMKKIILIILCLLGFTSILFADDGKIDKLLQKVDNLYEQGKVDKAIDVCFEILELEADNQFAMYNLSSLYLEQGKYDSSSIWADNLYNISSDDNLIAQEVAQIFILQGSWLYNNKEYNKADVAFSRAIEINPTNPKVYYYKALNLWAIEEHNDAIMSLRNAIALVENPESYQGLNLIESLAGMYDALGINYYNAGRLIEAEDYFRKSINTFPTAAAYYHLGLILHNTNRSLEALDWLDEHQAEIIEDEIQIVPVGDLYFLIGAELYKLGANAEVIIRSLNSALLMNPDDNEARKLLVSVFYPNKYYIETIEQLNILKKKEPEFAETYINSIGQAKFEGINYYLMQAKMYSDKGKKNLSEDALQKVLLLDPENAQAKQLMQNIKLNPEEHNKRYREGIAYLQKGDYNKAIDIFVLMLRQNPDDKEAEQRLEEAREERLKQILITYQMGIQAREKGDLILATEKFHQVLYWDPNYESAKIQLDELQPEIEEQIAIHLQKANNYLIQGRQNQSINEANLVLRLDSDNTEARNLIGRAKRESKQKIDNLYNTGVANYESGNYDTAKSNFEKVLRMKPNHRGAKNYLDKLNKPKQASPEHIRELYAKGVGFYMQGEYQKAIDIWEEVLRLDPTYTKAKDNIVKAKARLKMD